jgi:hypothetical protein
MLVHHRLTGMLQRRCRTERQDGFVGGVRLEREPILKLGGVDTGSCLALVLILGLAMLLVHDGREDYGCHNTNRQRDGHSSSGVEAGSARVVPRAVGTVLERIKWFGSRN